ncbi:MAG TPA: TldD/PmbA family protein [Candidatus Thermoplasmatota archaeon]|nr:TldD/PmbA family protein [Candidatus Thermoplasmatota archaeon]
MTSPDDMVSLVERALEKARRLADEAEVVLRDDDSAGALIRGALSNGRAASRTLLGARLRIGRRVGMASVTLAGDDAVDRLLAQARDAALSGAELAQEPRYADGERLVTKAYRKEEAPMGTLDARDRAALLAERVRGAAEYFTVSAGGARMRIVVGTTGGTLVADAVESTSAVIEARVNERIPRAITGHRMGTAALAPEGFAEEILEDLRRGQIVAALAPGRETVIFDADTASKILPSLTIHLSSTLVRQNLSRFTGKMGARILSEAVTIRDAAHGTALGGRAREVDDEGVRTRARDIVEQGVLRDLTYSAEEARLAEKKDAAGNGFRGGDVVDAAPRPGFVQVELAAGARPMHEIVASTKRAILVKHELLGWYHSTGVTGLLSMVAPCAFLVENGRIVSGLPPVTLGFDAIAALEDARLEVGADATLTPQGLCAPMVLHDVAVST